MTLTSAASPAQILAQGESLLRRGRPAEAIQAFRQVVAVWPDDATALNALGLALKDTGALAEAEDALRRAATAAPRDPAPLNNLGNVLRARGDLDGAVSAYRQTLVVDGAYVEAHYNLGAALESLGRAEEALASYRQAVQRSPRHARALTRIGGLLHERRRYAEALAALDAAHAVDAGSFQVRYYRGRTLSALGRHDEALAELAEAARQRSESFEAAFAHALALRDANRHDEALTELSSVAERWPGEVSAHVELNRLAWARGRRDVFLRSFASARLNVLNPELFVAEAAFLLRLNRFAEAERVLREGVLLAPKRADVANLLGRALAGQGRFEQSVEAFARAITAEPNEIRHRQELGFALLSMRRADRAQDAFQQALRIDPHDQLALAGLTLAWREQGDRRHRDLMDAARHVRVFDLFEGEGEQRRVAFHADLAQELRRLHTLEVEPIDQTLRGGTQTTCILFDQPLPAVAELRRRIEIAVGAFIGEIPGGAGHPFTERKAARFAFSGSWSCRLQSGGYHTNHIHPAGWISSAYYVALPDSVRDADHRPGWFTLGQSNLALGEHDLPEHVVQPGVGRLVLFPSYFWHGTIPFTDAAERLTVAFDVVPVNRVSGPAQ
jgi:tetratricopeptide (TPR) repeat protein